MAAVTIREGGIKLWRDVILTESFARHCQGVHRGPEHGTGQQHC